MPATAEKVGGTILATDARCSHGKDLLSEGNVEDGEIVCRFHLGAFDIPTGEPTRAPCVAAIATYHVTVGDNGAIDAELPG